MLHFTLYLLLFVSTETPAVAQHEVLASDNVTLKGDEQVKSVEKVAEAAADTEKATRHENSEVEPPSSQVVESSAPGASKATCGEGRNGIPCMQEGKNADDAVDLDDLQTK